MDFMANHGYLRQSLQHKKGVGLLTEYTRVANSDKLRMDHLVTGQLHLGQLGGIQRTDLTVLLWTSPGPSKNNRS